MFFFGYAPHHLGTRSETAKILMPRLRQRCFSLKALQASSRSWNLASWPGQNCLNVSSATNREQDCVPSSHKPQQMPLCHWSPIELHNMYIYNIILYIICICIYIYIRYYIYIIYIYYIIYIILYYIYIILFILYYIVLYYILNDILYYIIF